MGYEIDRKYSFSKVPSGWLDGCEMRDRPPSSQTALAERGKMQEGRYRPQLSPQGVPSAPSRGI